MNAEVMGNCWSCSRSLGPLDYGRRDSCPGCGRDTHVCKGCTFYDRSYNNECREPQADRVLEKEKANFCDYFKPAFSNKAGGSVDPMAAAKAAAEALFKKK